MYYGLYNHQLDEKCRFRIPAKLKAKLGDKVVVTRGSNGCLFLFSLEEYEEFQNRLRDLKISNPEDQKAARNIFPYSDDIECDNQGRYLLSAQHRAFAKIDKNIVIIGNGAHCEIWSQERWDKYNAVDEGMDEADAYDASLQSLQKYGI